MGEDWLKRANTCASECAEKNHPSGEHANWVAGRLGEAGEVLERVDASLAAAKELAAVIDPEAFEAHPIEQRREAAALQWAARRFIATEHAGRVLRSEWLRERLAPMTPAVPDPTVEALSEAEVAQLLKVWRAAGPFEVSPVAIVAAVNLILSHRTARAAAPDALRVRVEALAAEYDREADVICPRGEYDAKDKAWRVASVRRRVADDLRALLEDGAQ